MLTSLRFMRPLGALYAGLIALLLLGGGLTTPAPWAVVGGVLAAAACVLSGWGDRLLSRGDGTRDPLITLVWQSALCAVLVLGALVLATLDGASPPAP